MAKSQYSLIDISVRHAVYVQQYSAHVAKQFDDFLLKMSKSIDKRLADKDITEFTERRLQKLLKHTNEDMRDVYGKHYGVWREQLIDFADYEAGFEKRTMERVYGIVDFDIPPRVQLRAAVLSTPLSGITGADNGLLLNQIYSRWSGATIRRIEGIIRGGYYQGLTTQDIVRQIKGTRGLKYKDGELARAQRDITMLTRTAVQHAANAARMETYKENDDIIKGVQWVSTLDDRTTPECQSLDGQIFPPDEGPRPPAHVGCRSTTIPVLDKAFAALDRDATRIAKGEDGSEIVPASQTYFEWLKTQPPEFVESAIGPTRTKLLLNGGISATRFAELNLGRDFKPRTLAQIRQLEPKAFLAAGIK